MAMSGMHSANDNAQNTTGLGHAICAGRLGKQKVVLELYVTGQLQ